MNEMRAYFAREIPGINAFLAAEADKLDGLVRDVARHVLLSGGKRIRPMLTILFARAYGHSKDDQLGISCALEMLHTATLLHDDVLDQAETRRGQTSAHVAFGVTETILAGDILLALANKIGADYDIPRLNGLLARGIMATAEGEILELAHTARPTVDRQTYLDIIIGKTAKLIETACRCGAALASRDRTLEDQAGNFGLNLGIAFQLVDDALDYTISESEMGKPAGGDLREGKMTLPLILYLESLPEVEARELLAGLREKRLTEAEAGRIVAQVREKGLAEQTREAARGYIDAALRELDALPASPERVVLAQAAEYVLTRRK
ncbi:MAG: polyprenyl synthetase family protein [Humidesulfovibrio sp.]|jgi:octaprenyl-diphosphate synthase|uniref:polyprenyl synthetase family protein n=1 Tax=Humidesulfovibrio sp. TaxID=2910988 RepID=UPI002736B3DE|nr:polyprenyl synthetase family protein [Humidesulfovibrio sp.]MDP2847828.1 polyprenyl synthetase family protein [Humidesulfovibrio sp.]